MSIVHVEKVGFADSLVLIPKRKFLLRKNLKSEVGINATARRAPLSKKMVKRVERAVGAKFKKKPRLYHYKPIEGKSLRKRSKMSGWAGFSATIFNKKEQPIDTTIVLPDAFTQDKEARDIILQHELTETLAVQHGVAPCHAHEMAEAYDNRSIKKSKRFKSRQSLYATLKNLHNKNLKSA